MQRVGNMSELIKSNLRTEKKISATLQKIVKLSS